MDQFIFRLKSQSILLTFTILFSGVFGTYEITGELSNNFNLQTSTRFTGGDGSLANPFQISNITNLQNINSNLSAHYILINDIDASSTVDWNEGDGFEPIGPFKGTIDGNGHSIINLNINRERDSDIGLFSKITSAGKIINISLENIYINGRYDVGGLVVINYGVIFNCSVEGKVNCDSTSGGLLGENYGEVTNCHFIGDVVGENREIGGLVGNNDGQISNCYSKGNVNGAWMIGGLVGGNGGFISDCYSATNVSGFEQVGGLIGNYYRQGERCKNSYYCIDYTNINNGKFITPFGIFEEQYTDWIENDKNIEVGNYLNYNLKTHSYNIKNIDDLKKILPFTPFYGYNYTLISNIDLSEDTGFYISMFESGMFDGMGNSISNLFIEDQGANYLGMFGHLGSDSFVSNLSIMNCHINTSKKFTYNTQVGGLIGYSEGSVSNCSSSGNLNGDRDIGGLIGVNEGSITNCYSFANIRGQKEMGGLVGDNAGTISYCYSTGIVEGEEDYGGLVGTSDDTIFNSFWDNQTSNQSQSDGGIGKNTMDMKKMETFTSANWDFNSTWYIIENYTYPLLRVFWDEEKLRFENDLTPSKGTTGDPFTFNISVSDYLLVKQMFVEYWFDGEDYFNASMNKGTDYGLNITIPDDSIKSLHYLYHLCDIIGDWKNTSRKDVEITDNDLPYLISDDSNKNGTTGDPYYFAFMIADNLGIEDVWLEYWYGPGPHINVSLNGSTDYNYSIDLPFDYIADLQYKLHFNDTSNNWNHTLIRYVSIIDNDIPIFIKDHSPENSTTGEEITILIEVMDNIEIKEVWMEFWFENNLSHDEVEMSYKGSNNYSFGIRIPLNSTNSLYYIIRAMDISDLSNSTIIRRISVIDNIPPLLESMENITVYVGHSINITAKASDNIGIFSYVWKGTPFEAKGPVLSGTPVQSGIFDVTITVYDTNGNNISTGFSISILPIDNDKDEDGIPDLFEISNGLDLNISEDASFDPDNDGLTNFSTSLSSSQI